MVPANRDRFAQLVEHLVFTESVKDSRPLASSIFCAMIWAIFFYPYPMNELSLFLHQLIGPIIVLVGLAVLTNQKMYTQIYKNLDKEPLSLMFVALATLAVGFSIVLKH